LPDHVEDTWGDDPEDPQLLRDLHCASTVAVLDGNESPLLPEDERDLHDGIRHIDLAQPESRFEPSGRKIPKRADPPEALEPTAAAARGELISSLPPLPGSLRSRSSITSRCGPSAD
jgi:hypothetical protein